MIELLLSALLIACFAGVLGYHAGVHAIFRRLRSEHESEWIPLGRPRVWTPNLGAMMLLLFSKRGRAIDDPELSRHIVRTRRYFILALVSQVAFSILV